jgi:hypothetical protein
MHTACTRHAQRVGMLVDRLLTRIAAAKPLDLAAAIA